MPDILADAVPIPEAGAHVWGYFCELNREAAGGRITSTMMKDFAWSSGIDLELWERKAIKRLDAAYFNWLSK